MPILSMMMISVDPTKSSADSVTMPLTYLHRFVTGYPLQSGARWGGKTRSTSIVMPTDNTRRQRGDRIRRDRWRRSKLVFTVPLPRGVRVVSKQPEDVVGMAGRQWLRSRSPQITDSEHHQARQTSHDFSAGGRQSTVIDNLKCWR